MLKRLVMTGGAFHCLMLTGEGIACTRMRETRGGLPSFGRVALFATGRQLACVDVLVTRSAIRRQPEIRVGFEGAFLFHDVSASDHFFLMTFRAVHGRVLALQHVASQRVIEALDVDLSHGEVPAMVLLMAIDALLILVPSMKPGPGVEPGTDLGMTRKASVAGNGLPENVALRAVGQPFQLSVRKRQLPGRYLSARLRGE